MQFDPSHNSDIINYYYTNYSTCPKETSYFATWQFLVTFCHSVMIIQVPLVILTGYCILRKTPRAMGDLKWAMLNVHVWSTIIDLLVSSLSTPYIFSPAIGGFPLGLLRLLGVPTSYQIFIAFISLGAMFSSICALFEIRSSSFPSNWFRFERDTSRFAFFLINGILYTLAIIPVFWNIPNQDEAKILWLQAFLNCPTEEFFPSPVFFFIFDKFWGYYMSFILSLEIGTMLSVALFFVLCTSYYMFFTTQVTYSPSTQKLQKMFFIGNIIQIAIPATFWAFPLSLIGTVYLMNYNNQAVINIAVGFVSLHGLASMIVVLIIHRLYRVFVQGFFEQAKIQPLTVSGLGLKSTHT